MHECSFCSACLTCMWVANNSHKLTTKSMKSQSTHDNVFADIKHRCSEGGSAPPEQQSPSVDCGLRALHPFPCRITITAVFPLRTLLKGIGGHLHGLESGDTQFEYHQRLLLCTLSPIPFPFYHFVTHSPQIQCRPSVSCPGTAIASPL